MRKLLEFLFVITGGKFYFKYILITNPSSRNPINRWFCKTIGLDHSYKYLSNRIFAGRVMFVLHFILAIIYGFNDKPSISIFVNVLVNIYPMWVQVYIMYRCHLIMEKRNGRLSYDRI